MVFTLENKMHLCVDSKTLGFMLIDIFSSKTDFTLGIKYESVLFENNVKCFRFFLLHFVPLILSALSRCYEFYLQMNI